MSKIIFVGLGNVSGLTIDFLSRVEPSFEIVIGSRDLNKAQKKVNEVKVSTAIMSLYPDVSAVMIDLNNIKETADTLRAIKPDVIVNCTVKNDPHLAIGKITFPKNLGYGHFALWQAGLALNFIKSIREANLENKFIINTSYGDAVNWLLKSMGYNPSIGIGNSNHIIPRLKMAIAAQYNLNIRDINIKFVGGHYLDLAICYAGKTFGCPYSCEVFVGKENITNTLDFNYLFERCNIPVPPGKLHNQMAASDCVSIIRSYCNNLGSFIHAPGVYGLPGGYPIKIYREKIEFNLPENISLEEAVKINKKGLQFDGIETIKEDGTIVFMDKIYDYLKEHLDFDCKSVSPDEIFSREKELTEKFYREVEKL